MRQTNIALGLVILVILTAAVMLWPTQPQPPQPQQPATIIHRTTTIEQPYGIADQVEKVLPAVVHIEKKGVCQGSGCIVSEDGLIFTAKHVTDGGGEFVVTLNDGRKFETNACVEDSEYDVAFLKIEDTDSFFYCVLSDLSLCRVGDGAFIVGSPFGRDNFNSVSLGIISSRQRDLDKPVPYGYGWSVTFQTDATAEPGNSGGPVFNMDGEIIGVLVAGMDATVNYSVPVAVFMDDIDVVRAMFREARYDVVKPQAPQLQEEDDWYSYHSFQPEK